MKALTIETQLANITRFMNSLEETIAREQKYIAKHGEANDKDPDDQWMQYKADAEYHLRTWDEMKVMRDELKAQI